MPSSTIPNKIETTVAKTATLATKLAGKISGGEVFALIGPLGAGKTTFVQHLAKSLHYKGKVTSPTFVLMQTYAGKTNTKKPIFINHLDLYRLEKEIDIVHSGLTEQWGAPHTVTLIEWADKAPNLLPKNTTTIFFKTL